ncbi:putative secondary metabolism biosynthetic enzyme [Termitomyces sp. Mn162]|nr:putative secondary metabolism biosynthetic enzyme [Termitomyces sp. Mn162]
MFPTLPGGTFIRPHINLGYGPDHPIGVNSVPELVEFAASNNPNHIFGIQTRSGDNSPCQITFLQLRAAVEYASCWLVSSGCTTGRTGRDQRPAPVAILLGSDIEGGLPVPTFVHALGYDDLLTPDHDRSIIQIPSMYTSWKRDDLDALIMHSSGTTGLPKPIYHGQTYPLMFATCHRLPEQQEPFQYVGFGFLALHLSLSIGMPFILPPASVIPTGKTVLQAIETNGAQYLFTVPSILEEIISLPGGLGLETLKNLEIVVTGGAPMKESSGVKVSSAGVKLLNHWGCTELGPIVPIERIIGGYDWHYVKPRTDTRITIMPLDDGSQSHRLVGYPPGWSKPYEVQDLLVVNPHDSTQYRIMGRADDLLVLSTGEKVRPTNLEQKVMEHPDIKDVLAFGAGQACLGLLVELSANSFDSADIDQPETRAVILSSIQTYLERGNSFTDKHGKISNEMVVLTRETTKPFIRTDKGSLARKSILAAFDKEIKSCYEKVDMQNALPFPSLYDGGCALLDFIRVLVHGIACNDDITDLMDLFEAGMDSLQASRLRRAILNGLRVTPDLPIPIENIEIDFCFQNSSIEKLYLAIAHLMSGSQDEYGIRETKEERRIRAMEDMFEKYYDVLRSFESLAAHAHTLRLKRRPAAGQKKVVVLTGSTGSLGCFLLARLANNPYISKVICLNRVHTGTTSPRQRQMDLMSKRGACMSNQAWDKVVLHGADLSRYDFGLDENHFSELLCATHIIHNAWPVNFNRSLASFEPHICALSNLVRLALLSAGRRAVGSAPTRILFTSSIAVAGRFPSLHTQGPYEVPERLLDAVNSAEFGYSEAKWVCERLLSSASELYGDSSGIDEPLMQGCSVRIGQMTGPEGSGAWNESEHFPIIVRTSQQLGALPALEGSLSWLPVNRASNILMELLFSKGLKPFYHMENPSRQSWQGVMSNFSAILGECHGKPLPLIPLTTWLGRVRDLGDDPKRNVAYKILPFLERDFEMISGGTVILRMTSARSDSLTMVKSTALDRRHLEEYVSYWRSIGTIE